MWQRKFDLQYSNTLKLISFFIFHFTSRGLGLISSNYRASKTVVVYIEDQGFKRFADNMMKMSANTTNLTCLLPSIRSFTLQVLIEYLISGPKSYRDVRETDVG